MEGKVMHARIEGPTTELFTLGETLAVFLPEDDASLATARHYRRTIAGSEANVAIALARLGRRARLLTVVGEDGLGDAIESDLDRLGVDAVIGRSPLSTGVLVRELADGERPHQAINLRAASAATALSRDHVDRAWVTDPAAVFVTGITAVRSHTAREAVELTVQRAHESGALVVVDPNFRPRLAGRDAFASALAPLRGRIDVAIGDVDELALLSGSDPASAVDALLHEGCRWVIVKRGADGAAAYDGSAEVIAPSRATVVRDTVGAGDAFAAGVIAGLVDGHTMPECLERAAAVAARVVAAPGDIEGLPTGDELDEEEEGRHE